MEITSVTNVQTYSTSISTTNDTKTETTQEEPVVSNLEIEDIAIAEEPEELINPEEDAPKGVIRNLINGHFKGVADVRLRINFNDEITALEQAELAKVADAGLSTLAETINNEINAALGSDEIDEETSILIASALETFNNEISQLQTKISQSDDLLSVISSSFDNFVLSVKPVAEEPSESEPLITDESALSPIEQIEEIPVADTNTTMDEIPPEEMPQFSIEQFLTDLIATFETELELLETTLINTRVLPEISEPSGNGKAYDKFMTIYNEMKNSVDTDSQESQQNQINEIDIIS